MQHTNPDLEQIRGGLFPKYRLKSDYQYWFYRSGTPAIFRPKAFFIIPAGFEFDGATGGSFLFWRKSMHKSPHTLAHDYGYVKLGHVKAREQGSDETFSLTKAELDDNFLQGARREVNVQNWRSHVASGAFKTIAWAFWLT